MVKVSAFHSKLPNDPKVYHDNGECKTGNSIEPKNRTAGTGGRPKCQECAKLP